MKSNVASLATFLLFFFSFSIATASEPWEHNRLINSSTDPDLLRKLRALTQDVRDKGCDINLCFALQGDHFITEEEFQAQKDFVDLIVAITTTNGSGNYCAAQYVRTVIVISELTENKTAFLNRVAGAFQVHAIETRLAPSLGYTGFQLRSHVEEANHIIIIGNGLETIGFRSRSIAKSIRKEGIRISAVAIGGFSTVDLQYITGDSNLIFEIDSFFDFAEVIVGFVNDVCGL